jgi:hypothetical protein
VFCLSDKEDIVKPITPIAMNPIRRIQPQGVEERYSSYKKSKKASKSSPKKGSANECIITPEMVDCKI